MAAHGGPMAVAERLGWKLVAGAGRQRVRRPNGYWFVPENIRREIDSFIDSNALPAG